MNTPASKKDHLRILFLSVYESSGIVNMRSYISTDTDAELDYMIFGLPRIKKHQINQYIYFVDSKGEKTDKNITFNIVLSDPFYSLFKFIVHCYAFLLLLKITRGKKYDVCIAETAILGMLAWMFKKLGRCKMNVFHITDIYKLPAEKSFGKYLLFFEKIFRSISYKNDLIWYTQSSLKKWDEAVGLKAKKSFLGLESIDSKEFIKYFKISRQIKQICYIGRMDKNSGLDIAIRSIKFIRQKIPDIVFKIIGGSSDETTDYYKNLARKEGVLENVEFLGYIEDYQEAKKIMAKCVLGLALYRADIYTLPGKVLDYLQTGTPVVITKQGPQFKNLIKKYNAGILVDYDAKDAAKKITNILLHKDKYKKLQSGVLRLSKELDHSKVQSKIYINIINRYKKLYNH